MRRLADLTDGRANDESLTVRVSDLFVIDEQARDAAWAESSIGVDGERAEAVAAERARLRREVEGLNEWHCYSDNGVDQGYHVETAAVLELLDANRRPTTEEARDGSQG